MKKWIVCSLLVLLSQNLVAQNYTFCTSRDQNAKSNTMAIDNKNKNLQIKSKHYNISSYRKFNKEEFEDQLGMILSLVKLNDFSYGEEILLPNEVKDKGQPTILLFHTTENQVAALLIVEGYPEFLGNTSYCLR